MVDCKIIFWHQTALTDPRRMMKPVGTTGSRVLRAIHDFASLADILVADWDVRFTPNSGHIGSYENVPHARSVVHQIILLPARIRTAKANHP